MSKTSAIPVGVVLVVLTGLRQYGYEAVPPRHQADVWNIASALAITVLAAGWALWARSGPVWCLWLALLWHEVAVIACSAAYMWRPWPVPEGVAQCSAWVHADLTKLGAFVLLLASVPLASLLSRRRNL